MYTIPEFHDPVDIWLNSRHAAAWRTAWRTETPAPAEHRDFTETLARNEVEAVAYRALAEETRRENEAHLSVCDYFDMQMARLNIPALPAKCTAHVIPTPTQGSPLKRKDMGWNDMLVTTADGSARVTDDTLAAAIALAPPPVKAPTYFGVNNSVAIPTYQGARLIERVEQTKAGTWFYAVRLIADLPALTRFPAAVIDAYNRIARAA